MDANALAAGQLQVQAGVAAGRGRLTADGSAGTGNGDPGAAAGSHIEKALVPHSSWSNGVMANSTSVHLNP